MKRGYKKALVAGGAGFIGSHLADRLLRDGYEVFCVDNFVTGRKENMAHLKKEPRFRFLKHDIIRPLAITGNIDEIYNLASPASPPQYQKNPVFTLCTNVLGTKNLLDLAQKKKAKLLQASTSEVYGDPEEHPQKETYWGNVNPTGPRACYDEGKRAAETLCFDYFRERNVDVKVIRIFNTYGPRMCPDDGRVISNFVNQALRGENITIYGNGSHTRSFQYVDDLVEGMCRMMRHGGTGPINLGNPGEEHTIQRLAEIIIQLTGSKSKIIHTKLPENDPSRRRPDITEAKKHLKWEPKVLLEEGLMRTIQYFKAVP